jgi:fructosamine-3-kinase
MAGELDSLVAVVGRALGADLRAHALRPVSGGSAGECYRCVAANGGTAFLKVASAAEQAMLEAEAAGLAELHAANAVRVPAVLGCGAADSRAWLALEWISFAPATAASQALLGEQLARQHRVSAAAFGWSRDNTIGRTPQCNRWSGDWVGFLKEVRLRYQLELADRNGFRGRLQDRGAALLERMHEFFASYRPPPALLHGDLWGGNWATDEGGFPVIFDPAVYFGDREADLAMTRLFGGFGAEFYAAYEASWPLDEGARARLDLYNLYHVLNHLNLFGSGYLARSLALIERLLASLR